MDKVYHLKIGKFHWQGLRACVINNVDGVSVCSMTAEIVWAKEQSTELWCRVIYEKRTMANGTVREIEENELRVGNEKIWGGWWDLVLKLNLKEKKLANMLGLNVVRQLNNLINYEIRKNIDWSYLKIL